MNLPVKSLASLAIAAILAGILLVFLMGPFLGRFSETKQEGYQPADGVYADSAAVEGVQSRARPVITASHGSVPVGARVSAASFLSGITDADGTDLTAQAVVQGAQVGSDGMFAADRPGTYEIVYTVTDSYGLTAKKKIAVLVNEGRKGGDGT